MGAAAHNRGGRLGFILSATAAAAALYGAVVLFGLAPGSPPAVEASFRPHRPVYVQLRVRPHAVPRPVRRLPQASPGRARPSATRLWVPAVVEEPAAHRTPAPRPRPLAQASPAPAIVASGVAASPAWQSEATASSPATVTPLPAPVALLPEVPQIDVQVQVPPLQLPG